MKSFKNDNQNNTVKKAGKSANSDTSYKTRKDGIFSTELGEKFSTRQSRDCALIEAGMNYPLKA